MSKYTRVNINRENTQSNIAENFCSLKGLIFFSPVQILKYTVKLSRNYMYKKNLYFY